MRNLVRLIKTLLIIFIFVIGAAGIIGSGGGDGDGDGDGGGGGGEPVTIIGSSGNPVSLDGRWSDGCDEDIDDSELEVLTISGSSFTSTNDEWEDVADCSGTSDYTQIIMGTFTNTEETSATFNGNPVTVTKFDGSFSSAQATINKQNLVDDANANIACGYDDWVLGEAKSIINTECFDEPDSFKDIVYIDDVAEPDLWYSGDDDEPLDAEGYPTVLSTDSPEARL